METSRVRTLAHGMREALRAEVAARLDQVLAEGSPERLGQPQQVADLERQVAELGRDAVVEAAAYTWFNRLCALRYLDARGHTPVGVVTPAPGATQPELLACAQQGAWPEGLGLTRLVRDRVGALLAGTVRAGTGALEAAYRELLLAVCRRYAEPMPYLFGEGAAGGAASPLLVPGNLLAPGSVRARVVEGMDAEACSSVEVVGWLYQFYVEERKDEFFGSKRKAAADDIAPATQLFTPDWIVRYLVQNSLGRLWVQATPGSALASRMEFLLPPEPGEACPPVGSVEDLQVLDPACGSGHMLVYAFELLCEMYEEEGYPAREVPALVLRNNLRGLEIDPRAAELASFALEMCALERDPGFLERDVDARVTVLEPHVFEAGELGRAGVAEGTLGKDTLETLAHLDQVGSLWAPDASELAALEGAAAAAARTARAGDPFVARTAAALERALEAARALSERPHVVCANPPYMGSGKFNPWLSAWVRKHYPDEKGDLCCCFVRRGLDLARDGGYVAMVTMQSWMFLGSFEKMRGKLLSKAQICTMAHLGAHAFDAIGGEVVQTTAFALQKAAPGAGAGTYVRLVDVPGEEAKAAALREAVADPACPWRYRACQRSFSAIPGSPIAYWASDAVFAAFREGTPLKNISRPKQGLATADNDRFLRLWWEIPYKGIGFGMPSNEDAQASGLKWFPMTKGGEFRRWYGNFNYVVNWKNDGYEIKHFFKNGKLMSRPQNLDCYFKPGISWTAISSGLFCMRYSPEGIIPNAKGPVCNFTSEEQSFATLGATNSSAFMELLSYVSPTLDYSQGPLGKVPLIAPADADRVTALVRENIAFCREDWDSFETSWDFGRHPLCQPGEPLVERQFARWEAECNERFCRLKANEEELNRIFAATYGMEGEVPIEVAEDKVSVRRADLSRDVRSLVSYGVGCVFGRYSFEQPGLVLADAGSTLEDFRAKVPGATFLPDESGILPVTAEEWFEDDLARALTRWLAAAYGAGSLAQNLAFVERALGKTLRAYLAEDFFGDHCATYAVAGSKRRPIYWLVRDPASRGADGFQVLVYCHRWDEGTVGDILTGYLRPFEDKLLAAADALEGGSARDRARADRCRASAASLARWEREQVYPLAHERVALDLDDGVLANRARLAPILARA